MTATQQLDKLIPTLRRLLPQIRAMAAQVNAQFPAESLTEESVLSITVPVPYLHFMIMAASTLALLDERDGKVAND